MKNIYVNTYVYVHAFNTSVDTHSDFFLKKLISEINSITDEIQNNSRSCVPDTITS